MLKKPACRNGQCNLWQSFATIFGISLAPASSPFRVPVPGLSRRSYTQTKIKFLGQPSNAFRNAVFNDKDQNLSRTVVETTSNPSTTIPWYLQVDIPTPPLPLHSLAERQMIPELPENPPIILSPILQYLSVESGLDNLSLIDLRHLDPPPALGANLLMIIGTARSVKHLNVSADRFCRWLRSNYKMRPYADGLLGRNELKLKLRRKARRQKLAQSVGNTLEANKDDGITTGWICVNLGTVEGAEVGVPTAEYEDSDPATQRGTEDTQQDVESGNDSYIGFGSRSTAPRIVVQMFTEEKRAEMDLEGLWEARTTRRAAKKEKLDEAGDTASAGKANEEPFVVQRPHIGLDGDPTPSREGYDPPRPLYATAAS